VELAQKAARPFLRISLGVILFWIGALKFADPSPVVGLLEASLAFLAGNSFVYFLGVVEILSALALFANFGTRYVAAVLMVLFAGTLLIFVITPSVAYGESGFPYLSLAGEFLLKDLVLFGAALALIGFEMGHERDRQTAAT
jgi:uncharacterized membrane protein YkgB